MSLRILVAVDDSVEARRAAEQAADLAGRLGASVTLMTVIATPMLPRQLMEPSQLAAVEAHFHEAGERVLAQLTALVESGGIEVATKWVEGIPADAIVAEAANGYLLLVMGTRGAGLSGKEGSLLGSVSDRVLRQAPIPVVLVPRGS